MAVETRLCGLRSKWKVGGGGDVVGAQTTLSGGEERAAAKGKCSITQISTSKLFTRL